MLKSKVVFLMVLFVLIDLAASAAIIAVSRQVQLPVCSVSLASLYAWCVEHWASVALIVSELAALFSSKYSGILQSVLQIGNTLFSKKKD